MPGVLLGSVNLAVNPLDVPSTVSALRRELLVLYCVHSMWRSRSFKTASAAHDFVERLKAKYKRITFLSIVESAVLIDEFN